MICPWGDGLGRREELEGGASPGAEEEEAEDCCRKRRWPHAGLVGNDKCFEAAHRTDPKDPRYGMARRWEANEGEARGPGAGAHDAT